jgi:hypothetical protein
MDLLRMNEFSSRTEGGVNNLPQVFSIENPSLRKNPPLRRLKIPNPDCPGSLFPNQYPKTGYPPPKTGYSSKVGYFSFAKPNVFIFISSIRTRGRYLQKCGYNSNLYNFNLYK